MLTAARASGVKLSLRTYLTACVALQGPENATAAALEFHLLGIGAAIGH